MNFIDFLPFTLLVLGCPVYYKKLYGLETGFNGPETLLRWLQYIAIILPGCFLFINSNSSIVIEICLYLIFIEIIFRITIKYIIVRLKQHSSIFAIFYKVLIDFSNYNNFYKGTIPHPFLHLTSEIKKISNKNDYYYGFNDIKLSDVPKPPGIIRVACLGGSTTEDGYPEILEQLLNNNNDTLKYQVLNFGKSWWSSIHSTVNFILNVIDFKPDIVIVHHNSNEHHYRGYTGLRGDGAHAYKPFVISQFKDEWLSRYLILYRIFIVLFYFKMPVIFNKYIKPIYTTGQIGLHDVQQYIFDPKELYIFKRNLNTIWTICQSKNIKLILTTMPYSINIKIIRDYIDDQVYKKHIKDTNNIIKEFVLQNNIPLIDLDEKMTGKEEFFKDWVHMNKEGNKLKATLIKNSNIF